LKSKHNYILYTASNGKTANNYIFDTKYLYFHLRHLLLIDVLDEYINTLYKI